MKGNTRRGWGTGCTPPPTLGGGCEVSVLGEHSGAIVAEQLDCADGSCRAHRARPCLTLPPSKGARGPGTGLNVCTACSQMSWLNTGASFTDLVNNASDLF